MAKTMAHKLLLFCWLVVVIIGTSTVTSEIVTVTTEEPGTVPTVTTEEPGTVPTVTTEEPGTVPTVTTEEPGTVPTVTTEEPGTVPTVTTEEPGTVPTVTTEEPGTVPTVTTEEPGTVPTVTTEEPGTVPTVTTEEPGTVPTVTTEEPGTVPTVTTEEPGTVPTVTTEEPGTVPTVTTEEPGTVPTVTTEEPGTVPTVTTEEPGTVPTVTTEEPGTAPTVTTEEPGTVPTGDPDTVPTEPPVTEEPETDPCSPNPCGGGSTCEARHNGAICLCLPGRYYNEKQKRCQIAKVFPAVIVFEELPCADGYKDKTSEVFMNISRDIVLLIEPVFRAAGPGYIKSVVLELTCVTAKRTGSIDATVENIFDITSNITDKNVEDATEILGDAYKTKNLCNETKPAPCDVQTTTCSSKDGIFSCPCNKDYVPTSYSDSACVACPSGEYAEEGKCIYCGFGYSGVNCEEYWELILVIVGSGLGGLLLIMFIILPIVARKPSKKTSKKSKDPGYESAPEVKKGAKEPFVNGVNKAPAGAVPRIPRASANSGWDRGTNLEMTPSNSRQNLVPTRTYEDADEMRMPNRAQINPYAPSRAQTNPYAQNGAQTNPYAPNRAQTNPYDQHRAQSNPYAQSRGQTNPYYTHDDGGRLN